MKKLTRLTVMTMCMVTAFSATACGGKKTGDGDYAQTEIEGKTSIYVHVSNGGYGYAWMEEAAYAWDNEPGNEDYHIIVVPDTNEDPSMIYEEYKSGNALDMYFFSHNSIQRLINNDAVVDLAELLSKKPDGETGKTIEEKLYHADTVKASLSFGQEGKLYGLPYGDSAFGFIFDYDMFEEKGWLIMAESTTDVKAKLTEQGIAFEDVGGTLYYTESGLNYDAGDCIAACGKDGKYGTYDDGQPVTMAEWDEMIKKITETPNAYPFVYTTKYNEYLLSVFPALLAQYQGMDAYNAFVQYYGDYADENGNEVHIPLEEGYRVFEMKGFQKATEFMHKHLFVEENVHPKAWGTLEFSHRDAQNSFLLGYNFSATQSAGAMLVDGVWWEHEAKPMFKSLEDRGLTDRAYGQRDYRQMFYPNFDGQVGANGDGTGSVLMSHDNGSVFILKNKDPKIEEKCKDFLVYTLREEHLKNFTMKSGATRPYECTMSDAELATMTPYQRNVWQWYNDKENVTIIRPGVEEMTSPIVRYTTHGPRYNALINSTTWNVLYNCLLNNSASAYVEGAKKYNSHNWAKWMEEIALAQ